MPKPLGKNGWTRVAFGDVVRQIKDRVDPVTSDIKRYVAGEHMDSNSLRIRRWGTIGDGYLGPAFQMRFQPGHVLYGSRRTYLRKVAIADFEGITANTTFVLETKDPSVLIPDFLLFVMQTESFHKYSVGKSRGSVNPYVNFSDLESYQFTLPPPDEQLRLLNVLDNLVAMSDTSNRLKETANRLLLATYRSVFDHSSNRLYQLKEVADVRMGRQRSPQYQSGDHMIPYLRAANINDGGLDLSTVYRMNFEETEQRAFGLKGGDVLVVEGCGSRTRIGANAVWQGEISGPVCFQNTVIRLRAVEDRISKYLLSHWARYAFRSGLFETVARGTSILHIGRKRCEELPVRLPPTPAARSSATHVLSIVDRATIAISNRHRQARQLEAARTHAALFGL